MRKVFNKSITGILIFAIVICFASYTAATTNTTNELAKIKLYITDNNIQPQSAEETIIFAKAGLIYGDIEGYVPPINETNPENLADVILCLLATEKTPIDHNGKDLCSILAGLQQEDGSFGNLKATCKAMIALKASSTEFAATKGAEFVINAAQENGSIAETEDVFLETYLALTVLAPYRSTSSKVTETMKKAADFIKTQMTKEDVDYSPDIIAEAIMIITDLGGDPDEETYGRLVEKLLNHQNLDGSGTFFISNYGEIDRDSTIKAMRALDAVSYGASDLKTLSEMGKFSTGIDLEGLKPFLIVIAILAGLSTIMWIIVFTIKKPKTQTLEEYKASIDSRQPSVEDKE